MHPEDKLKRQAATLLGYMLFEFSRLDMEIGLYLAWSSGGKHLKKLTKKLANYNFNKRLTLLEELAQKTYENTPTAARYSQWLSDAHEIRALRNQFFHGRWGFSPNQQLVANVIGLPTSPEQFETYYSIDQLREFLKKMKILRRELSKLREQWPV